MVRCQVISGFRRRSEMMHVQWREVLLNRLADVTLTSPLQPEELEATQMNSVVELKSFNMRSKPTKVATKQSPQAPMDS